MAIAPITGKLRKAIWRDIAVALGVSLTAGYTYWYGSHLKDVRLREEYYLKLEQEKARAEA